MVEAMKQTIYDKELQIIIWENLILTYIDFETETGKNNVIYFLVTYLLIPRHMEEMKTKPTQNAVRILNEAGIQPDIILGRSRVPLDELRKRKISIT